MILDFYELNEQPFTATPDPKFFYLSATHQQAFASLLRSLQANRGFVTVLAQPGLGKTTLLLHVLKSFGDRVAAVYLDGVVQTSEAMLRTILAELGVRETIEDSQDMLCRLEAVLTEEHRRGRRVIVVVDQAHQLDASMFDALCALSALRTPRGPLIHFILCGQPLLSEKLAANKSTQSVQRLTPPAHLEPFSAPDTAQYVDHRLRVAGFSRPSPLFTPDAAALVARFSGGNPRIINRLCFEVLATAYRRKREHIGPDIVREVANDLDLAKPGKHSDFVSPLGTPAGSPVAVGRAPLPAPASLKAAPDLRAQVFAAAAPSALPKSLPGEAAKELRPPEEKLVVAEFKEGPGLPVVPAQEKSSVPAERPHASPAGLVAVVTTQLSAPLSDASEQSLGAAPQPPPERGTAQEPKTVPEEPVLQSAAPVAGPKRIAAAETVMAAPAVLPGSRPTPPAETPNAPSTAVSSSRPTPRQPVISSKEVGAAFPLDSSAAKSGAAEPRFKEEKPSPPARRPPVSRVAAPIVADQRSEGPVKPRPVRVSQPSAGNSGVAPRFAVLHSLEGRAAAAVLLVSIAGAALVQFRAHRSAATNQNAVAALARLTPTAYSSPEQEQRMVTVNRPKNAEGVTRQVGHAAQDSLSAEHNLKGMDLQSALRVLSVRTQSRQQSKTRSLR